MFHGQNSLHGSKWAAGSKNPREVNSLSLENARFLLDDKTVAGFEHSKKTNTYYNAISCLAYILSPEQTGICDELLALLHADILTIDENQGIPILSNDWHVKVDALLLNDMHVRWGRSAEKYGIIEEIGKLQEFWKLNEVGWMLRDEDEVIFSLDDIDEWREAFEQKHQAYSDGLEGIGRFY